MGYCILLVDNDAGQRETIAATLRDKLAYDVIAFGNAQEAGNYLLGRQTPKPDIILFDLSKDSADSVHSLWQTKINIPIVTLVKYGDYETAMESLSAGAQDFLTKPAALERMNTTFRNMLLLRDARLKAGRSPGGAGSGESLPDQESPSSFSQLALPLIGKDGNIRRMEELEAEAIRCAMQHYNGRLTEVARRLGIGRSTLYRKLNEFSIRQVQAA